MPDDPKDPPDSTRPAAFADEAATVAAQVSPELLALAEGSRPPVRREVVQTTEEASGPEPAEVGVPLSLGEPPPLDDPVLTSDASQARARPWSRVQAFLVPTLWGLSELALVALIASVVCVTRLLDLEEIEVGGDALKVWEFARGLLNGSGLPDKFDHHTSRFGLVLPTLLTQRFFGSGATTYFIGPVVASVTLHVFVYLIGRLLSGPLAGVLSVLFLLQFSPMQRGSSQILPETFGPAYVAMAYYAALIHVRARTGFWRHVTLGLAGAFLFFAYGAKESYLYFAPGLAFLIWFGSSSDEPRADEPRESDLPAPEEGTSRFRRVFVWAKKKRLIVPAVLTLVVVGLIVLESVFLNATTGAGGRLSVVSSSHGVVTKDRFLIRQFSDFFLLYTQAPHEWTAALVGGGLATLGLMAFGRDKRSRFYALGLVLFVLLQTFVVRKLNPLVPWTEPHPRYLLAMGGSIAVALGVFSVDAGTEILRRFSRGPKGPVRSGFFRLLLLLLSAALIAQAGATLPKRWAEEWGTRGAWEKAKKTSEQLTQVFKDGHPIVSESLDGKPAWAAAALYIDPHLLMSQGRILPSKAFLRKRGKGRYVARVLAGTQGRTLKRVDALVDKRMRSRRCAVVLNQTVRFVRGKMTVQQICPSLEEELKGKQGELKRKQGDERQKWEPG